MKINGFILYYFKFLSYFFRQNFRQFAFKFTKQSEFDTVEKPYGKMIKRYFILQMPI